MRLLYGAGGFSLVETLLALFIVGAALAGMARFSTLSARAVAQARSTTMATMLASQKMEQLRARDADLADTMAPDALQRNVDGQCDFFDEAGRVLERTGATAPAGSAFVRRWLVRQVVVATGPMLVLQVVVQPEGRGLAGLGGAGDDVRARGGAHVVWMKGQGVR